ncbi:MAG: hypothetical protein AABO58_06155 [Acidobacteriota bacterium]
MKRTFSALLALSLVLAGCKAKETYDKAKISQDLSKRGTIDLMKEVSNDNYNPPADGKLTDAQVQMYLKVRGHEKDIAQVAKAEAQKHAAAAEKAGQKSIAGMMEGLKTLGSAADMFTADIRAAKDLGYNTQEYMWVKSQVLGVSTAAMAEKLQQTMSASMDASYTQMKKAYDEAKDEQTKSMYKQMLDGYDQSRKEAAAAKTAEDPAVAYNRQILSKYENALNAFTHEMSKYEDKPGDMQKSMDEFQKGVDKATADAKKP